MLLVCIALYTMTQQRQRMTFKIYIQNMFYNMLMHPCLNSHCLQWNYIPVSVGQVFSLTL